MIKVANRDTKRTSIWIIHPLTKATGELVNLTRKHMWFGHKMSIDRAMLTRNLILNIHNAYNNNGVTLMQLLRNAPGFIQGVQGVFNLKKCLAQNIRNINVTFTPHRTVTYVGDFGNVAHLLTLELFTTSHAHLRWGIWRHRNPWRQRGFVPITWPW